MKVTHTLRMDLARCGCRPILGAVQGESCSRVLEISLYDNGVAWEIPRAASVDVAYQKPDGTQGIYSKLPDGTAATSSSGNVLTAIMAPQMLTCPGSIRAAIVFHMDGTDTLATFPFTIKVEANPAAGAERSEDYYNPTLSDLEGEIHGILVAVQTVQEAVTQAEAAALEAARSATQAGNMATDAVLAAAEATSAAAQAQSTATEAQESIDDVKKDLQVTDGNVASMQAVVGKALEDVSKVADTANQAKSAAGAAYENASTALTTVEGLVGDVSRVAGQATEALTLAQSVRDGVEEALDNFDEAVKVVGKAAEDAQETADNAHDVAKVAKTTADTGLAVAKKAGHPTNFLDNSDFSQPVNQRGAKTYTGAVYGPDRWTGATASITAELTNYLASDERSTGILKLTNADTGKNGIYTQRIEPTKSAYMRGKTFTFAVCRLNGAIHVCSGVCVAESISGGNQTMFSAYGDGGLHSISVNKNSDTQNFSVRVNVAPGENVSFKWMALYEGEYTAETLPAYQPKGYAAELAECRRYFYKLNNSVKAGLLTTAGKLLRFGIQLPVPLRQDGDPAILSDLMVTGLRVVSGSNLNPTITSSSVGVYPDGSLDLQVSIEAMDGVNNTPVATYCSFCISADV